MKRDFLSILDLTEKELDSIIKRALVLKKERTKGHKKLPLKGKTVGLIFEKSSTRTRVSFEVGVNELGGNALFLSSKDLQMGRGEPIKDTARVLSRYLHGIVYRCYSHETLRELARYTTISPLLTDCPIIIILCRCFLTFLPFMNILAITKTFLYRG